MKLADWLKLAILAMVLMLIAFVCIDALSGKSVNYRFRCSMKHVTPTHTETRVTGTGKTMSVETVTTPEYYSLVFIIEGQPHTVSTDLAHFGSIIEGDEGVCRCHVGPIFGRLWIDSWHPDPRSRTAEGAGR